MAHTHDTLCLTIAAFLVRDNKVLLVYHPKYSKWLSIGGHIDPGEDTDQALFREIEEEAGLTKEQIHIYGEKLDIPGENRSFMYTPHYIDKHKANDREHVALVYFGEIRTGEPKLSEEHVELRWFSKDELEASTDVLPDIRWFALRALSEGEK